MSQTAQTTTPQTQPQGTHHYVLTLEKAGQFTATFSGTCTPRPGSTRHDAYTELLASIRQQDPRMNGAAVMFWSLEPNQI